MHRRAHYHEKTEFSPWCVEESPDVYTVYYITDNKLYRKYLSPTIDQSIKIVMEIIDEDLVATQSVVVHFAHTIWCKTQTNQTIQSQLKSLIIKKLKKISPLVN